MTEERPRFVDWMCDTVGPKWVIARRTIGNLRRYGEDTVFMSHEKFDALKREYEAQWGKIY